VSWFARFTAPWRLSTETLDALMRIERAVDTDLPAQLTRMETAMADVSPLLNKLAEDLRTWSAGPFAALLADNARLSARNAELEGEDAAESSAAADAVAAFNEFAAPVTESPDVPVEIPPVEVPAEPAPADDAPPAA
jgi:hypothetical protein